MRNKLSSLAPRYIQYTQCFPQPFLARWPAWLKPSKYGMPPGLSRYRLALIFFQGFIFVLLVLPPTACSLYFLLLLVRGRHLDFCNLVPGVHTHNCHEVTELKFQDGNGMIVEHSATKVTIRANGPSRRLPLSTMPRPPGLIKTLGRTLHVLHKLSNLTLVPVVSTSSSIAPEWHPLPPGSNDYTQQCQLASWHTSKVDEGMMNLVLRRKETRRAIFHC